MLNRWTFVWVGLCGLYMVAATGCIHYQKPFNYRTACAENKSCPDDQYCLYSTGPDNEPVFYGKCTKYPKE